MQLITYEAEGDAIRAGYECACGCKPSNTYSRDGEISTDICCCGNEFAIGKDADQHVSAKPGFHAETVDLTAPWGEQIQAAWMVGPSEHPNPSDAAHSHEHEHGDGDDSGSSGAGVATDPVCGMKVEPPVALEKGLHSNYKATDYFFCGKGCKLDFDEGPERFLDPAYIPSM
jgi:YHS domain-containing protein